MQLSVLNNIEISVYSGDLEADVSKFDRIPQASDLVGGWSKPGKMPSPGYSIPASKCKTGSVLAHIEGSVCFGCYAADSAEWVKRSGKNPYLGRYKMANVKNALAKRYNSLMNPLWVPAQVYLIRRRALRFFRWHDSGDVQSISHLRNLVIIAEACPNTKFWLPCREYGIVDAYIAQYGDFPPNFRMRASAHMHNEDAPKRFPYRSAVDTGKYNNNDAVECPAYKRNGMCGNCRACWSTIGTIVYPYH